MDGLSWIDDAAPPGERPRPGAPARERIDARAERVERRLRRLADTPASLRSDVRTGLGHDEFTLFYQPRHELDGGHLPVVEALLRWRGDHRARMSPEVLLGAVAGTDVRERLSRWVLQNALRQAASWDASRPSDAAAVGVSVNVTPADLLGHDFVEGLALSADSAGIDPRLVHIEVAARTAPRADPVLAARLRSLTRLGVGVVVDGVDPWYGIDGSFLPCRSVNLSRQWVRDVGTDPTTTGAIAHLIERAHARGVLVGAIGVETRAQARALASLGCDLAQGFLFSEPVPPSELGWRIEDDGDRRRRIGSASRVGRAAPVAPGRGPSGLPQRLSSSTGRRAPVPA